MARTKQQAKRTRKRLKALNFDTAKDAAWRERPPSQAQRGKLAVIQRERGREFGGTMTRGRAHDIINEYEAARGRGPLAKERARAETYHARKAA
jgi:hypothetical protein